MLTVNAYGATSAAGPLVPMTTQRRDLGPGDVLVEIRYCGICHTDISHARSGWRPEPYRLIPGHEFTGVVVAVGSGVFRHAVGDRAGVGCMVGSCGECASCRKGQEQYCLTGATLTYGSVDRDGTLTQGGYSTHVVVDQDFVLPVPEGIGLAEAAPLLCAGITVYSPLRRWGTGPGTKVAVIGLGELGHLAVKFARAMGADVTVLSQSLKKQDDALRLGARSCYATSDPETFGQLASTFDLIVNTVSATVNVDAYLSLLAFDGVLANVGVAPEPLTVNGRVLVAQRRIITGSLIGGLQETRDMLGFCAQHHLAADIEILPAQEINEAYQRVLASDVRYRFVIDNSTLT